MKKLFFVIVAMFICTVNIASDEIVSTENYNVHFPNHQSVIITEYLGDDEYVVVDNVYTGSDFTLPIVAIDNNAFYHNNNLKEVAIKDGIETIRNSAFEGCENLEKITIPNSVTWISADAFIGDTNLIIYGESKSYAEKFASEQGIRFKTIGSGATFEVKINKDNFNKSLDIMGMGMAGMFIVSIIMAVLITVMNIVFDPKKKERLENPEE
ncbi:MAG: leucine-rich repeat domain-containing protein [Oscillospiraceae bacterium]|jgi:hypothetical protein|nr:leucine-rich repeat domain-containing protein [Oscillospiraceae bacterium]